MDSHLRVPGALPGALPAHQGVGRSLSPGDDWIVSCDLRSWSKEKRDAPAMDDSPSPPGSVEDCEPMVLEPKSPNAAMLETKSPAIRRKRSFRLQTIRSDRSASSQDSGSASVHPAAPFNLLSDSASRPALLKMESFLAGTMDATNGEAKEPSSPKSPQSPKSPNGRGNPFDDSPGSSRGSTAMDAIAWLNFNPHKRMSMSWTKPERAYSKWMEKLVTRKWFPAVFFALTFYALFVPDLDLWLGNKDSQIGTSLASTLVLALFLFEIVAQSLGKIDYMGRAHFWLDVVAALSLLPDTYFVQRILTNNAFVAGRSSRMARTIRLAARSTKVTRLNRLIRIVRVAALIPRLASLCGSRVKEKDVGRLLDKRLQRIFQSLDYYAEGVVPLTNALKVVAVVLKTKGDLDQNEAYMEAYRIGSQGSNSLLFARQTTDGTLPDPRRSIESASSAYNGPEIDYDDFKELCLRDDWVHARLRRACVAELERNNSAEKYTARHSEYIGVKVALGVLLLLFVLTMVEYEAMDHSGDSGLRWLHTYTRKTFPNVTANMPISHLLQEQVGSYQQPYVGFVADPVFRKLRYLDLNRKVYCDELRVDGNRCRQRFGDHAVWTNRTTLDELVAELTNSNMRGTDVVILTVAPEIQDDIRHELSAADFNSKTLSVVVFDGGDDVRSEGMWSIFTTLIVIVLIFGGIFGLTRDLIFLSVNLLRPLIDLSEELDAIVQLQLAGCRPTSVDMDMDQGEQSQDMVSPMFNSGAIVSEVRLMRRTFENMKKAITSWGKYVPWPVVHQLLRAKVSPTLQVDEIPVTMFWSDIASFTTIVESMTPAQSLVLLSRYFNDMSQIIDEYGGVVIEYVGDAIQCIYGAPVENPDHPLSAVQAALQMMDVLPRLNLWLAESDLPQISVRCGIHTGTVLVGNMGFKSRMKYGIVGEECHVAPKLEELCKTYSTQVLISQDLHSTLMDNLRLADEFLCRPIDVVHLRPHIGPMPEVIYEVRQVPPHSQRRRQMRAAFSTHAKAMSAYKEQLFEQAAATFDLVGTLMKELTGQDDQPSLLLAGRCRSYIIQPPDADWNGVADVLA
eukprot:TRINITY_DN20667_c0_g2_i1.p1 TRINITY_DN20667_c0_g2~~TRINITY_DN20667_c0_g2_i1.p1  ORF type:complete len:1074 (+),score=206.55 TRINITY_DN20667_c0_g2_i1:143-3364(+)